MTTAALPVNTPRSEPIDFWTAAASIQPNNFKYKSLSSFAYNTAVGCVHGCKFCYVPSVSARKMEAKLATYGVSDPDAQWGDYVLLRPWNASKFEASLRRAETIPLAELKPDGNRAVMFCSTTDPYQVLRHADADRQRELATAGRFLVTEALRLIRDQSTLNVRILTRSPLAKLDFDLFKSFGPRLLFGMSLPTLRNDLARIYEPKAPSPSQRLATLRAAKAAGLNVYVAMAPTYAECDEDDLRATLREIATLDPVTVFHEPINIRAENVARIEAHAQGLGIKLNTGVFETPEKWRAYAIDSLRTVERLAEEAGLSRQLHLWPDQALGARAVIESMPDPAAYSAWLQSWWTRISAWPVA